MTTLFTLSSSLSFGAPQLDFSMDFLFLRRETKAQPHHVMLCGECLWCPVVTGMMSPFTHQPNTEPALPAQHQSNCPGSAEGKSSKFSEIKKDLQVKIHTTHFSL